MGRRAKQRSHFWDPEIPAAEKTEGKSGRSAEGESEESQPARQAPKRWGTGLVAASLFQATLRPQGSFGGTPCP